MSTRFILHIIFTMILLAIGGWLFTRLGEGRYSAMQIATYWFAALVFILSSWLFYWFVHRLGTAAWTVAFALSGIIAAVATSSLLFLSQQNQQQFGETELIQDRETDDAQASASHNAESPSGIQTLNLSEEDEEPPE